jgi:acetyl-CoA C-acetyltransferase
VLLVVDGNLAADLGLMTYGLRLEARGFGGCDPARAGWSAVPAINRCVGETIPADLARVEFNEAYAGQTLACLDACGLDPERVCPDGGALAFGHPFGASGALLVHNLLHGLAPGQTGLAAVAAMGGQGTAARFLGR